MPNQSGKIVLLFILLIVSLVALISFYSYSKRGSTSSLSLEAQEPKRQVLECNQESEKLEEEVWGYLPTDLRASTYRKNIVSSGEATYEIYLLKPTRDCRFRGVLVELVARGGGAYTEEDFNQRGIYIYDNDKKELFKILKIPRNSYVETEAGFDVWNGNEYEFTLSEDNEQGRLLKTNYSYDLKERSLKETSE